MKVFKPSIDIFLKKELQKNYYLRYLWTKVRSKKSSIFPAKPISFLNGRQKEHTQRGRAIFMEIIEEWEGIDLLATQNDQNHQRKRMQ